MGGSDLMAADASIYSLIRPQAPIQGPLEQYGQAMSIKNLMGQGELQGLQRQQLTESLGAKQRIRDLFARKANPTVEEVAAVDPAFATTYAKTQLENKRTQIGIEKDQLAVDAAKATDARNALAQMDPSNPQSVQGFLQYAKDKGYQLINDFPQSGNPVDVAAWQKQHIFTADKFIEKNTPKYQKVDNGQTVTMVDTNPVTNPGIKDFKTQKQATPGEKLTDQRARELNGILDGQTSPDNSETVKAIANLDMPLPPRPSGARNPLAAQRWDALFAGVKKINPDYNAQDYQASQKGLNAFTSGQQGNAVRSFNTAISHLGTLSNLADALNNGNTPAINKIANAYATQTGGVAPVNFDSAKQIVGDEIVKAIVGAGGGVSDREKAQETVNKANSPAQLKAVIDTYKELMNGQLGGLRRQYEQATKRKDFDRFLSDEAKKVAATPVQTPAAAPSQSDIDAELRRRGVIK